MMNFGIMGERIMEIKFDIDTPNAFCDLIEGITIAILKDIKRDAELSISNAYLQGDIKDAKKRIKAVNVLLEYYGENNG